MKTPRPTAIPRILSGPFFLLLAALLALMTLPAMAETVILGGDTYVSGRAVTSDAGSDRDLFTLGGRVRIGRPVAGDAHVLGYSVDLTGSVGGDLYAAGSSIGIGGRIGEDATALGGTVDLSAEVMGNARLAGGTVTVDGIVHGALIAGGGTVVLNGEIDGDAVISAETLEIGPKARIGGALRYSAREPATIPEGVLPAERVEYEKLSPSSVGETLDEARGDRDGGGSGLLTMLGGWLLGLAFFLAVGAIFLATMPQTVRSLRQRALRRPWVGLLAGIAGLAMLLGLVPVAAMTVIGLPLVPVLILAIPLVWLAGYLLGAYAIAIRLLEAIRPDLAAAPALGLRLAVLAGAITVVSILNFVPVLGWLVNLALVLLGSGAIVAALAERLTDRRLDPAPAATEE